MDNQKLSHDTKFEYCFSYVGKCINLWKCLLFAVLTAILSMLSTSSLSDNNTSTVFVVFIGILIIMYTVFAYGIWGVITAAISSVLFCVSKQTGIVEAVINIGANSLQALCLYFVFRFTQIDEVVTDRGGLITDYKFILIALGVLYIILSILLDRLVVLYVFFGLIVACALIFSIWEKSALKILFLLLVAFVPSLVGGAINSISTVISDSQEKWYESLIIWTLSNTILFTTFGYIILSVFGKLNKNASNTLAQTQKTIETQDGTKQVVHYQLKLSTIMLYVATMIWNLLFYGMYLYGWLYPNTITYIFPWAVGNIFFLANLFFTLSTEIDGTNEDAFAWFENRAVVAEKNTQMIIAVITFLLPLSASYLGTVTQNIWFVFILNITTAVVSIGLIWVPKNNIRFMEFIKNLKTIFHLFTISLLLLNAIMIINGGIVG